MEIGNLAVDRSGPDTMTRTHLPYWMAVVVVLFVSAASLADGKTFAMVADPLSDQARTTMPSQRAIIAWDGTEQRLAIDTAFTGEGTEFAWLVPLPSEPEILPATKGMFDTAAVLAAPRIKRSDSGGVLGLGILLTLTSLICLALPSRRSRIVLGGVFLFVTAGWSVVLPALSTARGISGPPMPVEVVSTGHAGIYDTAVLRGRDANDLIAWLTAGGYGVPEAINEVVQDYLDKGWVFAAAKLRVDDSESLEHRAHPLQFRFAVDAPVYPMALTAIDNEDIALELFVFADGSAEGRGLEVACSLESVTDLSASGQGGLGQAVRDRPVTIAHPGLADIVGELGVLTRLEGTLAPGQQAEDIEIQVAAFRKKDPVFYEPGSGTGRGIGFGLIAASALGFALALVAPNASPNRQVRSKQQRRVVRVMVVVGVGIGTGSGLATPVYPGELASGIETYMTERSLREFGDWLAFENAERDAFTTQDVATLIEQYAALPAESRLRQGASPLHYDFAPGETAASIWYIWHDSIGAEHRTEITLTTEAGDDSG